MKFLGAPLDIPQAQTGTQAVRRTYVDTADAALGDRITLLEQAAAGTTLTYRGNWQSGLTYAVHDVVTYGGSTYIVVQSTSTTTAPSLSQSTPFKAIAAGLNLRGDWQSGVAYQLNDVVAYSGSVYVNIGPTSSTSPVAGASNAAWQLLASKGTDAVQPTFSAQAFQSGSASAYVSGSQTSPVINIGVPPGPSGSFQNSYVGDWAAAVYSSGQLVTHLGGTWMANQATLAGDVPGTSNKWTSVAARGATGATGTAPTVQAGTTTTAVPGTNAAVSTGGTASAVTLGFTIPRGSHWTSGTAAPSAGASHGDGDMYLRTTTSDVYQYSGGAWSIVANIKGATGNTGTTGTAATVAAGTTTTAVPGTNAAVTNAGSSSAASFNFTIPRGASWSFGTTTTPSSGTFGAGDMYLNTSTFDVSRYSGSAWAVLGNIKGATGNTGTAGTAATVAPDSTQITAVPGTPVAVSNQGSTSAALFRFTIPRGATWTSGTTTTPSSGTFGDGDMYLNTNTFDVSRYNGSSWVVLTNIKGATGTAGSTPANPVFTAEATGLAAGASPTASVTANPSYPNFKISLGVPAGAAGTAGTAATVSVGTVTPLAPGATPTVTQSGSAQARVLDFGLPRTRVTRGQWVASNSYAVGDMVSYANGVYDCIVAQGSNGTAPTPLTDNAAWKLITPRQLPYQEVVIGTFHFDNVTPGTMGNSGTVGVSRIPHTLGMKPSAVIMQPDLSGTSIIVAPFAAASWTDQYVLMRAWSAGGAAYTGSLTRVNLSLLP